MFARGAAIAKSMAAAVLGAALGGCLPYVGSHDRSTPLPDLTPHLSEDFRASGGELLVLAQTSRQSMTDFSGKGGIQTHSSVLQAISTPSFVKGTDLYTLSKTLKLSSDSGGGAGIFMGIPTLALYLESSTREQLDRLCILSPDGRSVRLSAAIKELSAEPAEFVYSNRRDAMVAALRGNDKLPFRAVDGPCGLFGQIEWSAADRARVIDYLQRMPQRAPTDAGTPVVRIFTSARNTFDPALPLRNSALILISTSQGKKTAAEVPLFVDAVDSTALVNAIKTARERDIIALLPSSASGMKAVETMSLEFCILTSDGLAAVWSPSDANWKGPLPVYPPIVSWLAAGLRDATSGSEYWDGCVPGPTWTTDQRQSVVAFLQNMRPVEPTRFNTAGRDLTVPAGELGSLIAGISTAGTGSGNRLEVMVIGIKALTVEPPLFLTVRDFETMIAELNDGSLVASLLTISGKRYPGYDKLESLCLVAADGRMAEYALWRTPTVTRTLSANMATDFRADAPALLRGKGKGSGGYECSLQNARSWPQELRDKVIAFFERIEPAR
jgi:hypothetical protein